MATNSSRTRQTKSGWKIFLQPGWIITAVLVIAFSYAAIWILSPWQLNKDASIVSRNEHVEEAFSTNPVAFDEVFDESGAITGDSEWKRVEITGHFLPDKEVLLRMRPVGSGPSYQALTPFVIDGGPTMLVNRGYEQTTADADPHIKRAPSGTMSIVANARLNEAEPKTAPMEGSGYHQVYGINTQQVSGLISVPLGTDYLQLTADSAGVVNAIPVPSQDRGNHLSYGFQWIAFGIMAPLGLGYFVYSEIRERRRDREETEEMAAAQTTSQPEPEDRQEALMRQRYGSSNKNYFERRR